MNPSNLQIKSGSNFEDDWEKHKDDIIWRRFWALWELRRKWKWADWFYERVDRAGNDVVEAKCWSLTPGPGYMKLCLWIALLRSVHEGITEKLDLKGKIKPDEILPPIPTEIKEFPAIKDSPIRDFRNVIFHCQWSPTLAKFKLDEVTTGKIEGLHKKIGKWLNLEFKICYREFDKKYKVPPYLVYDSDGNEVMPECFY